MTCQCPEPRDWGHPEAVTEILGSCHMSVAWLQMSPSPAECECTPDDFTQPSPRTWGEKSQFTNATLTWDFTCITCWLTQWVPGMCQARGWHNLFLLLNAVVKFQIRGTKSYLLSVSNKQNGEQLREDTHVNENQVHSSQRGGTKWEMHKGSLE